MRNQLVALSLDVLTQNSHPILYTCVIFELPELQHVRTM